MPKERIYDDMDSIEVQWSKNGQLVCVKATDSQGDSMWQATEPRDVDKLIASLTKARRQAWGQ
jgi:nitrate reductase NapAB chaperone NapD